MDPTALAVASRRLAALKIVPISVPVALASSPVFMQKGAVCDSLLCGQHDDGGTLQMSSRAFLMQAAFGCISFVFKHLASVSGDVQGSQASPPSPSFPSFSTVPGSITKFSAPAFSPAAVSSPRTFGDLDMPQQSSKGSCTRRHASDPAVPDIEEKTITDLPSTKSRLAEMQQKQDKIDAVLPHLLLLDLGVSSMQLDQVG